MARLTGPDGWLTLVGLEWLQEGENLVGSDPSNPVRLPPGAPARLGTILVRQGVATLHGVPEVGTMELRDDSEGTPTVVSLGSLRLHVINRDGRLAVRVRDTESPARRRFLGIERYPVDPRWRVEARLEPFDPPMEVPVPNVLGFEETTVVPGALDFVVDEKGLRLLAFVEKGTDDLFIVFGDLTNGDETYGAGRYLYAPPPADGGITFVDFNKAYNPPCVFTPYATCVLPLRENRLPIRVEAGERRYSLPA